jgi:hypothetical protein
MRRRLRGWRRPEDGDNAELDGLLAETWQAAAAATGQLLDIEAGEAALLAATAQQGACPPGSPAPSAAGRTAPRAHPRPRKRRLTARTAAAAGAVAALIAVAAAGASGAFSTGSGQQILTAAYIARVRHALAAQAGGSLVGYARTVLPPGTAMELGNGNTSIGPGASSPFGVGVTVTWSYQGTTKTSAFAPSGQPVVVTENTTVAGGKESEEVAVIYSDSTWWRATNPAPSGQRPTPAICGPGVRIGPGGWPAFIRYELGCGEFRTAGRQRVDGVEAAKLTGSNGTVLWVNAATYLPVRVIVGGRHPTRIDFRWLSPTRANLARLSVPIPAGFRQVRPPSTAATAATP